MISPPTRVSVDSTVVAGRGADGGARDHLGPARRVRTGAEGGAIRNVTKAVADAVGEDVGNSTWVVIEEIQRGDWGIGGRDVGLAPPPKEGQ